jgi:hypothetical protein
MKIKNIIILLLMVTAFISACQEEDRLEINPLVSEKYVYFDENNANVMSETAEVSVTPDGQRVSTKNQLFLKINRSGNDASVALVVNISTTVVFEDTTDFANAGDDASATVDFNFDDQVTIPTGSYSSEIGIFPDDDLLSSRNKIITLTITGVSDDSYELGLPNFTADTLGEIQSEDEARLLSQTIVIEDDDCPIDISGEWVGTYALSEEFTAGINDGFSFEFATIVQLDFNPSNPAGTAAFLGTASSSPAGDDFFVEETPLLFNTCPQTLTIPNPLILDFTVSGATATYRVSSATYSPGSKSMVFVGILGNTGGSNFGEYTITLTKN